LRAFGFCEKIEGMDFLRQFSAFQISAVLFLLLLAFVQIGFELGRRLRKPDEESSAALNTIKGAVLALLGLLLGFSFALSSGRFEQRRQLMIQEANTIGTAYLRGDLMEEPLQSRYKELLRNYTDARIESFGAVAKSDQIKWEEIHKSQALQNEIWNAGMEYALSHPQGPGTILLITALNQMIDTGTERTVARLVEVPAPILLLLFGSVLIAGFFVGHSIGLARNHNWLVTLLFSFMITLVVYIVLDLDQPRRGLIQERQRVMEYLRSTMK
jgi:hypothetical protein